ncbi:MAG: EamA family transporter [Polycyclovorans sp.]|jgi:drug/metabolite transporter (DMT)-like permease|uniref:DMT family transporter n=1 Tax=Hwanghaeella sp. 1Z406 TaxID=3402811 RepID=UPI000C4558F3|nr:EamA family transporter [Rhodospirillales bacterium]MAY24686.1 EamA family transporter [Polycyclovorans sp.]|tara:strand:- start:2594 stop:3511 length:918 start_codon:yes stop_codon:yes gene_type:complete
MPQKSEVKLPEIGLLILLSFLWGGSFTLTEIAIETIPPATIVCGRLIVGAILLSLFAVWNRVTFPKTLNQWTPMVLQGILQSALPFMLISWGQTHIDSGLAGLLNTTPPLFVFLIGAFLLHDRSVGKRHLFGILLGLIGVLTIMEPALLSGESRSTLGQLAVIGASLSYALAALYARRFNTQPAVLTAACSMSFAALIILPVSVVVDHPMTLAPTLHAVASVITLGVFSTAIAMAIYFRLIRTLGPLIVTTGSYMRAAFSVLLGVVLLQEEASATLILGLIMIFAAVAVISGHLKLIPKITSKKS